MNTMSPSDEGLPFLSNPSAIEYVQSSKLMVLVADNAQEDVLKKVSTIYGTNASCVSDPDESKKIAAIQSACSEDRHVIAVDVGNISALNSSSLQPYTQLAWENNYVVSLINSSGDLLPQYIGWHLNEADSCMLGLCAHALLEDLLRTVSEFCSDFRNFSQGETIPEMMQYYQLASSNHNGMLHCTAKYFGDDPPSSSKEYFWKVRKNITMNFENAVIGFVFTPRTFGARLKLSPEQLELWGGDDENIKKETTLASSNTDVQVNNSEEGSESVASLTSALAHQSLAENSKDDVKSEKNSSPSKKRSPRYFPKCQATLVNLSSRPTTEEPDFHPVSGLGRKAHMTIGVAPGVSAVTTGTDLLEIVELEGQGGEWPTYLTSRGWLRDYGEGRWVLYMNNTIFVDSLFAGVYVVS